MARSEQIQKFLLIPRFCDSSCLLVFLKPKAFSASPFVGVIRISTDRIFTSNIHKTSFKEKSICLSIAKQSESLSIFPFLDGITPLSRLSFVVL